MIFTGISLKYFKKIRQSMAEKDLSGDVTEVIKQIYQKEKS